jgi:hypothetical protein
MILISNHIKTHKILPIPDDVMIRINMAWIKTEEELVQIIEKVRQDIFLDFPQGRTKPPTPVLSLEIALKMMRKYKHITHFAVSNAESIKIISYLRSVVPEHIELVPKIETVMGVEQLEEIIRTAKTKTIMTDKEDLYLAVNRDNTQFNKYLEEIRATCKKLDVKNLELQGVIFSEYKEM